MQDSSAEVIENTIIEGINTIFAGKIGTINIVESTDIPYTMVGIEFEAYKYFIVRFNYDRGSFGCCIINGDYGIALESTEKWFDKADMLKFYSDIKEQLELRIPDKFLAHYGWQ